MKFVAFALALLLAVGSQAASLQADAPNQLAHARAVADVYLTQVKESAKKVLSELDDAEFAELKASLSQRLDDMHAQIKTLQAAVSPVTDNVVTTISEATADFRTSVMNDIDALKLEIEPQRAILKDVVNKHINEYRTILEPIIVEYQERHNIEMDALKLKLDPTIKELRARIDVNVEETKKALEPIVESVRAKLTERLEALKEAVVPYVEEYKENMSQMYNQAKSISTDDLHALKDNISPLVEEVKGKLQQIFAVVAHTFNKN